MGVRRIGPRGLSRRSVMGLLGASACSGFIPDNKADARILAGFVSGTVFEDRPGIDRREPGSAGLGGIMVSNGRDVVVTDEAGRWSLPAKPGDMLFVVKPSHWAVATSDHGVPRCAHILLSDSLPSTVDFSLRLSPEPENFDVLLVADTQPASRAELGFVRETLLTTAGQIDAAFSIHHGDVMGDDLSLFPEYLEILKETGLTWYHSPGNHDLDLDSIDPKLALETWKQYLGPPHYAFQYAGATFIVLNNVEFAGRDGRLYDGRRYRGRIGADQLQFVGNVLRHVSKEMLIVISMHIPLVSFDNPDGPADTTSDRDELLSLLVGRPNTVSFSGHSHTTEHHYLRSGGALDADASHHHHVLTALCGSWWGGPRDDAGIPTSDSRDGSPKGVHVLSVRGQTYKTRYVAAGLGLGPQMRALAVRMGNSETDLNCEADPTPISDQKISFCGSHLIVNVFDGGPKTRVTYEIKGFGSLPVEMQRTAIPDPHIESLYSYHPGFWKPWVTPAVSSHVWVAPLPHGFLNCGDVVLVRCTDEFG
ncbi:MAG: calcineurin-like phosphoesterase C-terminal domain-containing protein, partial [Hyphomicrobium sp.]